MLDYEKSIAKLIERVGQINESGWSPTPEANALKELAEKLEEVISLMDRDTYWQLEDAFNQPERGWVRDDGTREPDIDRAGRYAAIRWGMRELSEFAITNRNELPNPKKKHALPFAATGLLHIMYESGMDRPTLYNDGFAVKELTRICTGAGIYLSTETLRGALKKALDQFDPLYRDAGISDILIFTQ